MSLSLFLFFVLGEVFVKHNNDFLPLLCNNKLECGADDFIAKPFEMMDFLAKVKSHIA